MEPDQLMLVLGTFAVGLILVASILGVGIMALQNVYNQTETQYGALIQDTVCLQGNITNTSTCGLSGQFLANATPLSITGNWTNAELLSDNNQLTHAVCTNITGAGATDVCGIEYNFTRPIEAVSANVITYLNFTQEGDDGYSRSDALPAACLDDPVTINYTKNFATGTLYAWCYNGAAFQSLFSVSTNGTYTENQTLADVGLNWSLHVKVANYQAGGSAATFAPITYVLSAGSTMGSWLGIVVITAIASIVIALVFVIVRAVRGDGNV